jgi:hypothetical protein
MVVLRSATRFEEKRAMAEKTNKMPTPSVQRGVGSEIVAGMAGGVATGAAGAVVQQGLSKITGSGKPKNEPQK